MISAERYFQEWVGDALRYAAVEVPEIGIIESPIWAIVVPETEYYDPPSSVLGLTVYSSYNGIISLAFRGVKSRLSEKTMKAFYEYHEMEPFSIPEE